MADIRNRALGFRNYVGLGFQTGLGCCTYVSLRIGLFKQVSGIPGIRLQAQLHLDSWHRKSKEVRSAWSFRQRLELHTSGCRSYRSAMRFFFSAWLFKVIPECMLAAKQSRYKPPTTPKPLKLQDMFDKLTQPIEKAGCPAMKGCHVK